MYTLDDIKKFLIQSHPDFCCPITKKILDYRRVHIINFNGETDIVSVEGWDILPESIKQKYNMSLIDTIEKYLEIK